MISDQKIKDFCSFEKEWRGDKRKIIGRRSRLRTEKERRETFEKGKYLFVEEEEEEGNIRRRKRKDT